MFDFLPHVEGNHVWIENILRGIFLLLWHSIAALIGMGVIFLTIKAIDELKGFKKWWNGY